jgi:DNA-binding transcriptional LysR family regulator
MDGLNFDFRQLRAFITLVEAGSFTSAAQKLDQTQSAVSQLISALEANLNTQLVDRSKRPVRLTLAGQEFYEFGFRLLSEGKQLEERIYAIENGTIPQLKIGIVDSIGQTIGLAVLKYLQPKVSRISQITGTAPDLLLALQQSKINLALTMMHADVQPNIKLFPLINEDYVVVTPRSWSDQTIESLCKNHKYIAYAGWTPTGWQTLNWLKWRGLKPNIQFEVARADNVLELIAAGYGWTLATPLFLSQNSSLLDDFTLTPLPLPGLQRRLVIMSRSGELTEFMPPFVDHIKHILSNAVALPIQRITR